MHTLTPPPPTFFCCPCMRVQVDGNDLKTPGWRYNYWELKGVPVRVEVGPRDVEQGACVLARRDVPGGWGAWETGAGMGPAGACCWRLMQAAACMAAVAGQRWDRTWCFLTPGCPRDSCLRPAVPAPGVSSAAAVPAPGVFSAVLYVSRLLSPSSKRPSKR